MKNNSNISTLFYRISTYKRKKDIRIISITIKIQNNTFRELAFTRLNEIQLNKYLIDLFFLKINISLYNPLFISRSHLLIMLHFKGGGV